MVIPAKKTHNQIIGGHGEQITANYLTRHGYHVIERNYRKKWGEIDVIGKKDGIVHFVEVKTVSYETKAQLEQAVLHGTWRPEENVHPYKLRKLARAIESWLQERNWQGQWQIDVASVRIVPRETYATIKIIENVIVD